MHRAVFSRRTPRWMVLLLAFGISIPAWSQFAEKVSPVSLVSSVDEVVRLPREAIRSKRVTVDVKAVLTLPSWDDAQELCVQDGTNALWVSYTNRIPRQVGLQLRIQGIAAPGPQFPVFVDEANVEVLGPGKMPEALSLPVAHLFQPEFFGRWIEQEGVVKSVDRQKGPFHLVLDAPDAPVEVYFYEVPGESTPNFWLGRHVRMQGVCETGFDAEGRVFGFLMHVPGTNWVSEAPRSNRLLERAQSLKPKRSASSLADAMSELASLGDPPRSPANLTNTLPVLTNVQQVLALGLEGARAKPYPVRLVGTITCSTTGNRSLYIDDGTGGIEVVFSYTDRLPDRPPGLVLWVDGIVGVGPVHPWIAEARMKPVALAPLPSPKRVSIAELTHGRWHGQWVELEGMVRDMARNATLDLLVSSGGQRVEAVMPYPSRLKPPEDWLEARVSMKGLCEVSVDFSGRPTHARVFLNSTNDLRVIRPGNTNFFTLPLSSPEEYRRHPQASDDRIRVQGTVLFHSAQGEIFLRDSLGGVHAELLATLVRRSSRTTPISRPISQHLRPGDRIELVGAPAATAFAPKLIEAEYRQSTNGPAPQALLVGAKRVTSGQYDSDLIQLTARVVGRERIRLNALETDVLTLEEDGVVFEALDASEDGKSLPTTPHNSLVRVTGICVALAQQDRELRSFRVLLRGREDLQFLGFAAPWRGLQPGRVLAGSTALGAIVLMWVWLLRRQVAFRTAELRGTNDQLSKEVAHRRAVEASLRASEARKAAVLESALDSIITIDQHGSVVDFNPAAEKTFGYSRAEAMGREMAELLIPPAWRERHRMGLRHAVESGVDTIVGRRVELPAMRRNGDVFTVELALSRIATENGPLFTAHIQDISDRKRAEEDRERALADEKELNELKSRFVTTVSHEFRTPLGIINSSAEILEAYLDRLSPEERATNLHDIVDASQHMASLMEEVLLLGRVESGKLACRPATLEVELFCKRLVADVLAASHQRCPIQLYVSPSALTVLVDESLVRHILTNLLSNASKYSPAGSVVQLSVVGSANHIEFTVKDHGIGIPEADARQLYQAFHRGRNVGDAPGTGLGMSIVKRCVEIHGGTISFQSQEGKGTTFVVLLPTDNNS